MTPEERLAIGRERAKRYYAAHREERLAYARVRYHEHKEELQPYRRAYNAAHRDELNASQRVRNASQREKQVAYSREWQKKNKARRDATQARWRDKNREKLRVQTRAVSSRRRARKRAAPGSFTTVEWLARLVEYGDRCAYCGVSGVLLEAEHVVPLARGGSNDISNIVPACQPCNRSKWIRTGDEFRALQAV